MTRMMLRSDGPRIAASTIASGMNGMTRNHSDSRERTESVQPPKKPPTTPTIVPMITAMSVAATPTSRLTCEP